MLLQSNESRRAYRVPVPDKYRLARYARARSSPLGGLRPGRRITKYLFQNFPPAETSYMPIVAPETNHRGYENPRRTLAGFSVSDLRTRFIDQCPSIHLLRVNGKKKQRNVRESVLHYIGTNISYERTIAPETERSCVISLHPRLYRVTCLVILCSTSSAVQVHHPAKGGDGVVEREEE